MARVNFGRPNLGSLRSPLSPGVQKELTANPLEQAQKEMKISQGFAPKMAKMPAMPKRQKKNPFFGE